MYCISFRSLASFGGTVLQNDAPSGGSHRSPEHRAGAGAVSRISKLTGWYNTSTNPDENNHVLD